MEKKVRRPGDHADRGAGGRRAGHRSHGSAAREPRAARRRRARRARRSRRRKPPTRAQAGQARAAGRSAGSPPRARSRAASEAATPYGVRDVERLLHLSAQHHPLAGRRRLRHARARRARRVAVLLPGPDRAAHGAGARRRPTSRARRITRSMRELRRHLPESMPLSGLAIGAVADRVVVREGASRWQAESGQYLLEFEGDPASGALSVIERAPEPSRAGLVRPRPRSGEAATPPRRWTRTSRRSPPIRRSSTRTSTWGRLLHDGRRLAEAERVYRGALTPAATIRCCCSTSGCCSRTWGASREAIDAYEDALQRRSRLRRLPLQPGAPLREAGRPKDAIRHMARYRVLAGRAK